MYDEQLIIAQSSKQLPRRKEWPHNGHSHLEIKKSRNVKTTKELLNHKTKRLNVTNGNKNHEWKSRETDQEYCILFF